MLVDTAFVLPIFLVLILASMELGTLFFVRHSMLNASRDAVRSLSIGEVSGDGAADLARDRLPVFDFDFTVDTSSDSSNDLDCWVEITAPLSGAALNDPLGLFGGGELQVRVTMRKED